jgi:hypothetical protein
LDLERAVVFERDVAFPALDAVVLERVVFCVPVFRVEGVPDGSGVFVKSRLLRYSARESAFLRDLALVCLVAVVYEARDSLGAARAEVLRADVRAGRLLAIAVRP